MIFAAKLAISFSLVAVLGSTTVCGQDSFENKVLPAWRKLAEIDTHREYHIKKRVTRADGSTDDQEFVVAHHGEYAVYRSDAERTVSLAGPDGLVTLGFSNPDSPVFFLKQEIVKFPKNPQQVRDEKFEFKKTKEEHEPAKSEDEVQNRLRTQLLRQNYFLSWQGIENKFSLSALDDLSKTEWIKETEDGILLTLNFQLSDQNSSTGVGHYGFVIVEPNNGFRIHSSELVTNTQKTKRVGKIVYKDNRKNDFSSTYEIYRMNDDGEYNLGNRFEYEVTLLRENVPLEEFTLAHYGLTVPNGSRGFFLPKWMFWAAIVVIGALFIAAWNKYRK